MQNVIKTEKNVEVEEKKMKITKWEMGDYSLIRFITEGESWVRWDTRTADRPAMPKISIEDDLDDLSKLGVIVVDWPSIGSVDTVGAREFANRINLASDAAEKLQEIMEENWDER